MVRYSEEFKLQVLEKMMPPARLSMAEIGRQTGITQATLYHWRKQYRLEGHSVPASADSSETWPSADKFAIVVETLALNETQLGEYCRKKGLFPEQIAEWKQACQIANAQQEKTDRQMQRQRSDDKQRIKQLEKELARKEKALAEAAALLILSKKAQAIWGDSEDV
jgi:transposase-like protein